MTENPRHHYDDNADNQKHEQFLQLAAELGFVETAEMVELSEQIAAEAEYIAAEQLFIAYRVLGERQLEQLSDSDAKMRAQIGLLLGMAALYFANQRFEELEEYFYAELDDARMQANNLPNEAEAAALVEQIDELW